MFSVLGLGFRDLRVWDLGLRFGYWDLGVEGLGFRSFEAFWGLRV